MAQYKYINKQGGESFLEASSDQEALLKNKTNADANPNTGVQRVTSNQSSTSASGIAPTTNPDGTTTMVRRTVKSPKDTMESAADVRRRIEREFDKRRGLLLGAISKSTKGKAEEIRRGGEENLASTRSINLRSGLGGSDFGAANKAETKGITKDKLDVLEAERLMLVEQALTGIDQAKSVKLSDEYARLDRKSAEYTAKQKELLDNATAQITSLGKAGYDLNTIKEKDSQLYNDLIEVTGKGDLEIEAMLNNAKPAEEKIDYTFKTVGSKVIGFGVDPKTGKLVTLEQDLGINLDTSSGGAGSSVSFAPDGTMLIIPKNFSGDPSEIIVGGSYGKDDIGTARSDANAVLTKVTGPDGKVSPDTFKAARNIWVSEYKQAADKFNEEFANLINFNDPKFNENYGVPVGLKYEK